MQDPNNSCYKRVYVGDLAGSTITVNGKPIVNNINGDTVVGIDSLGEIDTDVFDNQFYNVTSRYIRSTYGERDSSGNWVTATAPPHDAHIRCTYDSVVVNGEKKGDPCANPTGDTISTLESPLSCSAWDESKSRTLWIRHDINNLPVTTDNPNAGRSVYKQRDHIRMDYGRYEGGVWVTKPTEFIDCVRQDNLRIVVSQVSVGDWEFAYEDGVLMAREEGYTDYLEPERNTKIVN